jgi:hypothetical protein
VTDIKTLLKTISGNQRQAQNALFSGKLDECYALLDQVDAHVAAAVAQAPDEFQVKNAAAQAAKLRKDADKRGGRTGPSGPLSSQTLPPSPEPKPAPDSRTPAPGPEAQAAPAAARVPAGVAKRMKDARDALRRGKHDAARESLAEARRAYAGQFDETDPDWVELLALVEEESARHEAATRAAEEARAEEEAKATLVRERSAEWRERLQRLGSFGHRTGSAVDLLEQRSRCEAARAELEALAGAGPMELEPDVAQKREELAKAAEGFPAFFEATRRDFLDTCLQHVKGRSEQLDRTVEGKPSIMNDRSLAEVEAFFQPYAVAFEQGSADWAALGEALDALRAKNLANRRARAKLTTVLPDVYAADDAPDIRAFAEGLVRSRPTVEDLVRTVITKDDWAERAGWEDYAGDRRFVTRREIYAQVVARESTGVLLHSLYVTKELRADGTWSKLAGNVMWSEDMAPENLA